MGAVSSSSAKAATPVAHGLETPGFRAELPASHDSPTPTPAETPSAVRKVEMATTPSAKPASPASTPTTVRPSTTPTPRSTASNLPSASDMHSSSPSSSGSTSPISSVKETATLATPALTTTFTPPPECTQDRLTMLEMDASRIWLNEPMPVPNTTISSCYPAQFMTSFLAEQASTQVPAFSPLVCPENYHTAFQHSVTDQPLYIACCPSNFTLAPPATSVPGRPAYGGTCYSSIMTETVTLYNNHSSSAVTVFAPKATTNQAFAHLIDGFAMAPATSTGLGNHVNAAPPAAAAATTSAASLASPSATPAYFPPSAIAGISLCGAAALAIFVGGVMFCTRRSQRRREERAMQFGMARSGGTPGDDEGVDEEPQLLAIPYGDPNRRPSDARFPAPEMHGAVDWAAEVPRAVRFQGAAAAAAAESSMHEQHFAPLASLAPIAPPEPAWPRAPSSLDDGPPPTPPPRSPDRDAYWARYPTPATVTTVTSAASMESVSTNDSRQPLNPRQLHQRPLQSAAAWNRLHSGGPPPRGSSVRSTTSSASAASRGSPVAMASREYAAVAVAAAARAPAAMHAPCSEGRYAIPRTHEGVGHGNADPHPAWIPIALPPHAPERDEHVRWV